MIYLLIKYVFSKLHEYFTDLEKNQQTAHFSTSCISIYGQNIEHIRLFIFLSKIKMIHFKVILKCIHSLLCQF